ncbi:TetR/AcrR family transcriptional regulator [Marinomonas algicola]|uniref:TetR/AcrR family transcriptional regulator n=1 Tax=Marinomonas algicola TaxID=2773454 RepID=UPI00174D07FC|nr:TetR/AcrR family transcriptional regulator [Marinomonas algicola]
MKTITRDTKQHILATGYQLISAKGFVAVGLSEILNAADIPKGSFYHYFKSKEQFGEALIQHYFDDYKLRLNQLFHANEENAYTKMHRYWQSWLTSQSHSCSSQKCLVVKLSAEVSDLSEPMRLSLFKGTQLVQRALSDCIKQGIADNSIQQVNADDTAKLLYNLWIGASLMTKLSKDDSSLKQAMSITESMLNNAKQ